MYIPHYEAVKELNRIWFIGRDDNVLYSVDCATGAVRSEMNGLRLDEKAGCYAMCIKTKGDRVICLPDLGNHILDVDLLTKNKSKIELIDFGGRPFSYSAWIKNNTLWFVSAGMNCIVEYDLDSRVIRDQHSIFNDNMVEIGSQSHLFNNCIYVVNRKSPTICVFDIDKKITGYIDVQIGGNKGFETVFATGNKLFLTGYRKEIYCWDLGTNRLVSMPHIPQAYELINNNNDIQDEHKDIDVLFYKTIKKRNYLLFIPWNTPTAHTRYNMILRYELSACSWDVIRLDDSNEVKMFRTDDVTQDNVIRINYLNQEKIVDYDLDSGKVYEVNWNYDREHLVELMNHNSGFVFNEKAISLDTFIYACKHLK